ncbi:hypothetical protein [Marinobacter sp. AN1]|uniref:hypothetical protein n=1 Tax=Marinobacter sp. AN1 TaxID=2886046 RepID=UPI00223027D0|nr:hypothetical protein [Marinobacter sp. AN1]UZD67752.1 hypothetical protein LJ360_19350 [Marinobacter sp. AN1]
MDRVLPFEEFGRQVKDTVYQNVGLPVCVGIAPTRTLTKTGELRRQKVPRDRRGCGPDRCNHAKAPHGKSPSR